jgi:hypothetical protein
VNTVWNLLLKIRMNPKIEEKLHKLEIPASEIISGSTHKILYCLIAIKKFIEQKDWVLKFIRNDGLMYLFQLLQVVN